MFYDWPIWCFYVVICLYESRKERGFTNCWYSSSYCKLLLAGLTRKEHFRVMVDQLVIFTLSNYRIVDTYHITCRIVRIPQTPLESWDQEILSIFLCVVRSMTQSVDPHDRKPSIDIIPSLNDRSRYCAINHEDTKKELAWVKGSRSIKPCATGYQSYR